MKSGKRVKTPTVLQMEVTECGAAALAIILGYYQRFVSLEELRIACGVSRDGSKAINMLRAARNYGLSAQGAQVEMDALPKLTFPFIAFWEFNHFVVVEGFDDKKIYLNDPATGPRTVTYDEFSRAFTGIILLFEPTSSLQKGGQKESLWMSLKSRLTGVRNAFIYITLASLSLVIPGILIPGFSKIFIDQILIHHLSGWLLPLIWGLALTAILRAALMWIQQIHLIRLQLKLALTTSAQFLWHVLHLPITFFTQRFAGDISSRIAANDRIATLISGELSTSIVSICSMILYAVIMALYDWTLTLIGISIALTNAALLYFVARRIANNSRRFLQEQGKLMGVEMSGIQAIETLKATGTEDDFFQKWAGYHAKTLNSQQRIQLYSSVLVVLPQLLTGILTTLILGVGGLRIMHGYLTVGGLVAFQTLLASFNAPLVTLLGFGGKLQEIRGDLTRLDDVLRHPEDNYITREKLPSTSALKHVKKLNGTLTLNNISFGYSVLEPPILNDISFTVEEGKSLAIVGASGSGKSTLAKIICGLYSPWSGEVLIDNNVLTTIPRDILSRTLSFVDQDIFLFDGTIRDNLTLWNNHISNTAIEYAINDAELSSFLDSRPQGLSTQVINQGVNFSGGQRQQLEIARALTIEPMLLILDEATASLDAIAEANIVNHLKKGVVH